MRGHFGSRWEQQVGLLRLLFEKAMVLPTEDVEMEMEDTSSQHKGKGGVHLKKTTGHFEMKYRAAANAETMVQLALATDGDIDMSVDAEHRELTEALRRMAISDGSSPKDVDTETSTDRARNGPG